MDLSPGWKPDPTKRYPERYWDGLAWTDRVRDDDGEVADRFEMAMKTPLTGTPKPTSLFRRPVVRLLLGAALAAGVAAVLLDPVRGLLDGVPDSARQGHRGLGGAVVAARDIADAATDGRWNIVATYHPDDLAGQRTDIAARLRECFGGLVSGSGLSPQGEDPAQPLAALGPATTLVINLDPRPDQLVDSLDLTVRIEHDGTRWVLQDPLEAVADGETTSCVGRS